MSDSQLRGRRLFFVVFTVSGFSGLIYEAIWSHYLKLFLGHAAYAQTLVLAIFMGGMALGSWLMAKYSHRIANLLLGYAIVEGAIGLFGLVFHPLFTSTTSFAFGTLLPATDSVFSAQLVKWSLGALLILPQSTLLGMTFPLMSGATVRRFPERSGETLAMLYFTNSLGAALGVLISGFVLIAAVGLPGTITTAGLLNVALALFVWGIVKYRPDAVQSAPIAAAATTNAVATPLLKWMLIGAAVTGAASFFYEIAWIRMLSLVLGSSTHSFELMLSAFILGIALGGLWVRRRIDSLPNPVGLLATLLFSMAGVAILSLPLYGFTFDLMSVVMHTFSPTPQGYVGVGVLSHVIAMLMMIPTTFFCGMTLPIMTQVLIRGGTGERAIGSVYAWNTAGAIVGVVIAVHLLLPTIGVKGVVLAGAALQVALGIAYRSQSGSKPARVQEIAGTAVIGVVVIAAAAVFIRLDALKITSGVFRTGQATRNAGSKVLFLEDGRTATISLTEDADGVVSIATNGKPDAAIGMRDPSGTVDEITMVMLGALPSVLHPNPRHVAAIGMGSGLTTHVLLANPIPESVETIEIEPLIAKAARFGFMPRVARTFTDPRSHVHFEDAKTFFATHKQKYDVIVSEPSNPWVSGVATLFSQEFYRQASNALAPDGMLVQWLQIYEIDMDIVMSVVGAMAPQFSDFALYSTNDQDVIIVATKHGTLPPPDARAFAMPQLRAEMARVGLNSPQDIQSRFLGNRATLLPLLASTGIPANSDYFPFVDLNAPRARILKHNAFELPATRTLDVPFFELLSGHAEERGPTLASTRPTSARDSMTVQAIALAKAIQTSRYEGVDATLMPVLLTLQSNRDECANPAVQRAWLASAYIVASNTTTPLSAQELAPVWDHLASSPCASLLPPQDQQMFQLLQLVAQRNVAQTAIAGTTLFVGNYAFADRDQRTFALLATAASAIATHQSNVALVLLQNYSAGLQNSPAVTFSLKWLTAIASRQSTIDTPVAAH